MIRKKYCHIVKSYAFMFLLFFGLCFMSCAQKQDTETENSETENVEIENTEIKDTEAAEIVSENTIIEDDTESKTAEPPRSENNESMAPETEDFKQKFGADCIAEQTFEAELSEYGKKVWFVPFAPSGNSQELSVQIISEGEVLTELPAYIPKELQKESFRSLDAVSFYDINYDDNTDIILIETYGNTTFAAVYYGYVSEGEENSGFVVQDLLSEHISAQVTPLSVPQMRSFLADGKKNGEFSDYREAYEMVSRLCEMESTNEVKYNLIYFDEDDIPELAAGVSGYYTSLYTYDQGKVYTLMDHWSYGVMGNSGYEYCPKKNSLRNYNSDYAGAIVYTTYMSVNGQHTMDMTAQIETLNFDDVNQNKIPDEDELDSYGSYGVNYIDGREITASEAESYNVGEYQYIDVIMSAEELRTGK